MKLNKIYDAYNRIFHPSLYTEVEKSKEIIRQHTDENAFQLNIIDEMLSDKYTYKGPLKNRVYVKNLNTGEPELLKIHVLQEIKTYKNIKKNVLTETYILIDKNNDIVGEKDFKIIKTSDSPNYTMRSGDMENKSKHLAGIGFRLDQMHIERALQLGIQEIPRLSLAPATLYHVKMGFFPTEEELEPIHSVKEMKLFGKENFCSLSSDIPNKDFKPVIINKNGKFYIDVNKTIAFANLDYCKKQMKKYPQLKRIDKLDSRATILTLSGKELEHWKELLKGKSILNNLSQELKNP